MSRPVPSGATSSGGGSTRPTNLVPAAGGAATRLADRGPGRAPRPGLSPGLGPSSGPAPRLGPNRGPASGRAPRPGSLRRTQRLFWLAAGFFVLGAGVGTAWDRSWHASHPFEDFWSPPHRFIYAMLLLAMLSVAWLVLWRPAHRWLGPTLTLPAPSRPYPAPLPVPVPSRLFPAWLGLPALTRPYPASLALLGGGLGVIALAGLLDLIWHSRFGLDETGWSLPHAMLGWGILLTLGGFVAVRLALASWVPIAPATRLLGGTLLLAATARTTLGPFAGNTTDAAVRAVAALPVLAQEAPFQHTARIYLGAGLTREHWPFVLLAALAAGASLAVSGALLRHPLWVLAGAALATWLALSGEWRTARYFGLEADPRTWLPLPILPAAAVWLSGRAVGQGERRSVLVAGLVFGLLTTLFWRQPALLALPAAALFGAGWRAGAWGAGVLQTPSGRGVAALVGGLGLALPAALGVLDLSLRARIP